MRKILIVEDDYNLRTMLKMMIRKKFNFEIFEAENGIEGLSQFQENLPDLILLDIAMPLMNGKEFLEALRNDKKGDKVPVMVITAMGSENLVNDMLELGVSEYILKPFMKADVLDKIKNIAFSPDRSRIKKRVQKTRKVFDEHKTKSLVFADKDEEMRNMVQEMFEGVMEVHVASNGATALDYYFKHHPHIMILSEGLPLLKEQYVVKKIQDVEPTHTTGIFLCDNEGKLDIKEHEMFDGVIKRSMDSPTFLRDVAEKVFNNESIYEWLKKMIKSMEEDIVKAVDTHLGKSKNQDILRLKSDRIDSIDHDIYAVFKCDELYEDIVIQTVLYGSQKEFTGITELTKHEDLTNPSRGVGNLSEFAKIIGNQMREVLKVKGILTKKIALSVKSDPHIFSDIDFLIRVPFQTEYIAKFVVGMAIQKRTDLGSRFKSLND